MNTIDLQSALVPYLNFTRRDGNPQELCTGSVPCCLDVLGIVPKGMKSQ